jgi:DNA mismatch endonuclease (patch repair protein)
MKPDDPGYPTASSQAVSNVMKGNRKIDSGPETALRRELFSRGLRYRKNAALRTPIGIVRPDIVFPRQRVAVFVDGCFWHSCPAHGNQPSANVNYWLHKLARNRERDQAVNEVLSDEGWLVVRVWEHQSALEAACIVEGALACEHG